MAGSKRSRAAEMGVPCPPDVVPAGAGVTQSVSLADVKIGRPFREDGIRQECIEALMASPERWSPILVEADGTVVDGRHRVLAARRLGLHRIPAVRVDEEERPAAGIVWGEPASDPASPRDRHIAVRRVLCSHPEWADRRIGDLCGISPKTVARIRTRMRETFGPADIDPVDVRVGRDGRARPLDAAAKRERIVEALIDRPDASLRSIARAIGVSPETVRSVRAKLTEPAPPLSAPSPACTVSEVSSSCPSGREWNDDNAFASRDDSAVTAQFFDRTAVDDAELGVHVAAVPLSRVYEVADDARRRAAFWTRLAERVEARAKRRSC